MKHNSQEDLSTLSLQAGACWGSHTGRNPPHAAGKAAQGGKAAAGGACGMLAAQGWSLPWLSSPAVNLGIRQVLVVINCINEHVPVDQISGILCFKASCN